MATNKKLEFLIILFQIKTFLCFNLESRALQKILPPFHESSHLENETNFYSYFLDLKTINSAKQGNSNKPNFIKFCRSCIFCWLLYYNLNSLYQICVKIHRDKNVSIAFPKYTTCHSSRGWSHDESANTAVWWRQIHL